jgi:hypothetical protein
MLLCHLLACHSPIVRIVKVRFPGQTQVQFGVVASKDLAEGSFIVELCCVLSSDIVEGEHVSAMEAHSTQLLRKGPRLMTGPARFVNHSCKPNASVSIDTFYCIFAEEMMNSLFLFSSIHYKGPTLS